PVEVEHVGVEDAERREARAEVRHRLGVHLDGREPGVARQQRPRQRPLPRPDLDDRRTRGRPGRVHDLADDVGVGEEVLAEALLGADGHRRAKGEGRRAKGEGRRAKGEGRRAKGGYAPQGTATGKNVKPRRRHRATLAPHVASGPYPPASPSPRPCPLLLTTGSSASASSRAGPASPSAPSTTTTPSGCSCPRRGRMPATAATPPPTWRGSSRSPRSARSASRSTPS